MTYTFDTSLLRWPTACVSMVGLCVGAVVTAPATQAGGPWTFNRDVRPILSEHCFACHGPDSVARQADLRLDDRTSGIESKAIVPGKPGESELVIRINSADSDTVMPPPKSHKILSPHQRQVLTEWIESGAEYEPHWSLLPPKKPDFPEVRSKDWVRDPVDLFILAKLETSGLEPSPEADLNSLVRRVTLDLTGLPPTPEDLASVLQDPRGDRYERYVDRLLDRQTWGEHRGRYWLDYARYADTHGIHFDNFREVWAYRDWVIEAFNRNLPFDQFTREQLAGDLLPNPTMDQRIATGFNRCNITTNEGGIIDEEYRVLYARDRTETVAAVWMGMTAGCAVCHDHKFDPLNMRDFYSMSAFFNNTTQDVRDGNRKDTPPIIVVPPRSDRARHAELESERRQLEEQMEVRKQVMQPQFDDWRSSPSQWTAIQSQVETAGIAMRLHIPLDDSTNALRLIDEGRSRRIPLAEKAAWQPGHVAQEAWVNPQEPGPNLGDLANIERDESFTLSFWIQIPKRNVGGSVLSRMDVAHAYRGWDIWLEEGRVAVHLVHAWPGDAIKLRSKSPLDVKKWTHVAMSYDGSSKAEGFTFYVNGAAVETETQSNSLTQSTRNGVPLRLGGRSQGSPTPGVALQDFRLYSASLSGSQVGSLLKTSRAIELLTQKSSDLQPNQVQELKDWYWHHLDATYRELDKQLATLAEETRRIERRGTIAHVMSERSESPKAYILYRGEYDKRRDEVTANTPAALLPMRESMPRNRLGLAEWLLDPEHPLTARVTVNRFWQEVFGTGIVATAGDFGVSGQSPSDPELLDYLAISFREGGWDVKNLFRRLVTSATYRQSSVHDAGRLARDPQNRLLGRGPRYRMDAEMVRDSALAASGLLVPTIGGPSVRPYQPPGVWEAVAMPESNTRRYVEDVGDGLYRRSMYTFWKRSAPPASMEIMNAPSRENCTVRRDRTNTPLQALLTLNDTQFVEAARFLAQRILLAHSERDQRLRALGAWTVARNWTDEETKLLQDSLDSLMEAYRSDRASAEALLAVGGTARDSQFELVEHAAWCMLANQVMNLDEFLNK